MQQTPLSWLRRASHTSSTPPGPLPGHPAAAEQHWCRDDSEVPCFFPDAVTYLRIAVKDRAGEPIHSYLDQAVRFISNAIERQEVGTLQA